MGVKAHGDDAQEEPAKLGDLHPVRVPREQSVSLKVGERGELKGVGGGKVDSEAAGEAGKIQTAAAHDIGDDRAALAVVEAEEVAAFNGQAAGLEGGDVVRQFLVILPERAVGL